MSGARVDRARRGDDGAERKDKSVSEEASDVGEEGEIVWTAATVRDLARGVDGTVRLTRGIEVEAGGFCKE